MIVVDANVLIGHLESADSHHARATALLGQHLGDSFGASVITLAEVYTGAARAGQAARLTQVLATLQIDSLALPDDAAPRLGQLRASTQLRMPDCCVLYTAERYQAAIATFDEQLANRARELGVTVYS